MDIQLAWVRMLLVEPYRDKKRHPTAFKPEDFSIYQSKNSKKEMTPDEQLKFVKEVLHPYFVDQFEKEKRREKLVNG